MHSPRVWRVQCIRGVHPLPLYTPLRCAPLDVCLGRQYNSPQNVLCAGVLLTPLAAPRSLSWEGHMRPPQRNFARGINCGVLSSRQCHSKLGKQDFVSNRARWASIFLVSRRGARAGPPPLDSLGCLLPAGRGLEMIS